jgi:hypothetical protein
VFTLVTVVFLSLSFASSFFGMKTIGIRNLQETQPLFWATAFPTTVVISGISLLVVSKGSNNEDWMMSLPGALRQRRNNVGRAEIFRRFKKRRGNDEEAVNRDTLYMQQTVFEVTGTCSSAPLRKPV